MTSHIAVIQAEVRYERTLLDMQIPFFTRMTGLGVWGRAWIDSYSAIRSQKTPIDFLLTIVHFPKSAIIFETRDRALAKEVAPGSLRATCSTENQIE